MVRNLREICRRDPGLYKVIQNLFVKVPKSGTPFYLYIYYKDGKRQDIYLGLVTRKSIPQVKQEAKELTAQRILGQVPEKEVAKKPSSLYLVQDLIKEAIPVIANTKKWKNEKSLQSWENTCNTYVLPVIGKKPVKSITKKEILLVLQPIWEKIPETASKLRGRLENIFNYAIMIGKYEGMNPCTWKGNLDFFLVPQSKVQIVRHHTALSFNTTKEYCQHLVKSEVISHQAILFGILTASRVGEFIPMKWEEIDLKEKIWECPPERRKDGKKYPHRVPLSLQLVWLLMLIPRTSEYVFPSPTSKDIPISKETPRVLIQKRYKSGTMHGFRSTFRDWCAENGKDRILAEKALMHATGNEVEQAYQRSDLLEQRRVLMQEWADALFGEIKPS